MKLTVSIAISAVILVFCEPKPNKVDPYGFLIQFGYAEKPPTGTGLDKNTFERGVKKFQAMMHIPQTGKLDAVTSRKMNSKRCGMADFGEGNVDKRRIAFATRQDSPWSGGKKHFTWFLEQSSGQFSSGAQRSMIDKAFRYWADVSGITARESSDLNSADIKVRFASRFHGDANFDGPGGVLAHAFYPDDGRLHMDDEESWRDVEKETGTIMTLVHELGHNLGLTHSSVEGAVMYPSRGTPPEGFNFQLDGDDIYRIQRLYGGPNGPNPPKPTKPPVVPTQPSGRLNPKDCDRYSRFDSIVQVPVYGESYEDIFAFVGRYVWRLDSYDGALEQRSTLQRYFPGLPSKKMFSAFYDRDLGYLFLTSLKTLFTYDVYRKRLIEKKKLSFTTYAAFMDPEKRNTAILMKTRGSSSIYFEFNTITRRVEGRRKYSRSRWSFMNRTPTAALISASFPDHLFLFSGKSYRTVDLRTYNFVGGTRSNSRAWLRCSKAIDRY
ncbi:DgyrCDS522 [Dimorphilus gyrociliatus]|uniref:DgyrCDS522 n=1 Tax=Dimorphilus gyrociliatus TaxID=2664684 RepID=A0A7I8V7M4_9ANNE|nr:DgyrCDS522 [Dimorphilus gyrociliatus]